MPVIFYVAPYYLRRDLVTYTSNKISITPQITCPELLPELCEDQQVSVIPYQVLMGGLLTGAYDRSKEPPEDSHMASRHAVGARQRYWDDAHFDMVDRLKAIAAEAGHTPVQLVLAWALSKPAVTSVIVGASRPEQVVQNAQAVAANLPQDVLEQLDSLG